MCVRCLRMQHFRGTKYATQTKSCLAWMCRANLWCTSFRVLWWAFKESAHALQVPATFLMISTTMFASLLFWVEQGSYSEELDADVVDGVSTPAFTSIVNAAYFAVVTYVVSFAQLSCAAYPVDPPVVCCALRCAGLSPLGTATSYRAPLSGK